MTAPPHHTAFFAAAARWGDDGASQHASLAAPASAPGGTESDRWTKRLENVRGTHSGLTPGCLEPTPVRWLTGTGERLSACVIPRFEPRQRARILRQAANEEGTAHSRVSDELAELLHDSFIQIAAVALSPDDRSERLALLALAFATTDVTDRANRDAVAGRLDPTRRETFFAYCDRADRSTRRGCAAELRTMLGAS